MITLSLIPLLAAGYVAPASAASQAQPARLELPAVVARVQSRYDQAKDFQAHFTQTYSRSVVGRVSVSAGQSAINSRASSMAAGCVAPKNELCAIRPSCATMAALSRGWL